MASKLVGEHKRIPVADVLRGAHRKGTVDVVVVTMDDKGELRVFGTSGSKMSDWMLAQGRNVVAPLKVA